nr:MAG TPA: hypothetical protein [Caudoviricetes sp.]
MAIVTSAHPLLEMIKTSIFIMAGYNHPSMNASN